MNFNWLISGGSLSVFLFGQQGSAPLAADAGKSGASVLETALAQDMTLSGVAAEAGKLAGLGVSAQDAALIVAGSGLGYKLLQMAHPFSNTVNDKLRQKWKLDVKPPGA